MARTARLPLLTREARAREARATLSERAEALRVAGVELAEARRILSAAVTNARRAEHNHANAQELVNTAMLALADVVCREGDQR